MDIDNRVSERFPQETIKVISYKGMKHPFEVVCTRCRSDYRFAKAESFFDKNKAVACRKCVDTPQRARTKNRFANWYRKHGVKNYLLIDQEQTINYADPIDLLCLHCNEIDSKSLSDYVRGRRCVCLGNNQQITEEEFEKEVCEIGGGKYHALSGYQGRFEKVLMRHSCGHEWEITPKNFIEGRGCPKCNRMVSKGEREVEAFLTERCIEFMREWPIEVEGRVLRIDFYIPDISLGIEYNGIQHYEPVEFFGGESKFRQQQYNDSIKAKYCGDNNIDLIVIRYDENIQDRLSMFND